MGADTYTTSNHSGFEVKEMMLTAHSTQTVLEMNIPPKGKMPQIKPGDVLYVNDDGYVSSIPSTKDGKANEVVGVAIEATEGGSKVTVQLVGTNNPNMNGDVFPQSVSGIIYADSIPLVGPSPFATKPWPDPMWSMADPNATMNKENDEPELPDLPSPCDRWDFI